MFRDDHLGGVTATLSIKDLASTDFDTYNCTVINERGMSSGIFTLQQKGKISCGNSGWGWYVGTASLTDVSDKVFWQRLQLVFLPETWFLCL